jgi:DNA-binding transcriptional LysR family regulator
VLTEYDAASSPPTEPGLGLRQLTFDPYLLVIPPDWQITPRSLRDLAGLPWVAGPPGTACDQALRLAAEAAIVIPAGDVCVEFPSVLALVAAGRGAAIVPQLAVGQTPVTVCTLPPLGGRQIAAWHPAGAAQPTPAAATVLDTLAQAAQDTTASATAR